MKLNGTKKNPCATKYTYNTCVCSMYVRATSVSHRKLWLWKLPVIFSYHILTILPKKSSLHVHGIYIHVCMSLFRLIPLMPFEKFSLLFTMFCSPIFFSVRFGYLNFSWCFASFHHIISFLTLQSTLTKITMLFNDDKALNWSVSLMLMWNTFQFVCKKKSQKRLYLRHLIWV